jgi:hypothetical protein
LIPTFGFCDPGLPLMGGAFDEFDELLKEVSSNIGFFADGAIDSVSVESSRVPLLISFDDAGLSEFG